MPAALGWTAGRAGLVADRVAAVASLHVVASSVAFPALVVHALATAPEVFPETAAGWAVVPLTMLMTLALVGNRTRSGRGAQALALTFGNVAYLGFPVAEAVEGPAALGRAALFASQHVLVSLLVGLPLAAGAGRGADTGLRVGLQTASRHPLFWAPVAGLGLRALGGHGVATLLGPLAAAASPLAALLLGLWLSGSRPDRHAPLPADLLATRLALLPALTWATCAALHVQGYLPSGDARLLVLLAAMPTGIAAFSMAETWRIRPDAMGRAVVLGTALAPVTATAWLALAAWAWPR